MFVPGMTASPVGPCSVWPFEMALTTSVGVMAPGAAFAPNSHIPVSNAPLVMTLAVLLEKLMFLPCWAKRTSLFAGLNASPPTMREPLSPFWERSAGVALVRYAPPLVMVPSSRMPEPLLALPLAPTKYRSSGASSAMPSKEK